MKKNILKYGFPAIIWFVFTLPALAGPADPPGSDDPPYQDPMPINSWELVLIMIAIIIGVYFLANHRRKARI